MGWSSVEVLEDKHHVEVLEAELYTLEMYNLNFGQCNDKEGILGKLHQAVDGRLNPDTGAGRHTVETQISDRNIDLQAFTLASIGDLVGKGLEFLVQLHAASSLFLFLLELFLVSVAVLSLAVPGFVEGHVCCLTEELNIFDLLLTNHDWVDQVNMDYDNHLMLRWLEEDMLDIAKQDFDFLLVTVDVAQTVLMDLDFAGKTLAIHGRTQENH